MSLVDECVYQITDVSTHPYCKEWVRVDLGLCKLFCSSSAPCIAPSEDTFEADVPPKSAGSTIRAGRRRRKPRVRAERRGEDNPCRLSRPGLERTAESTYPERAARHQTAACRARTSSNLWQPCSNTFIRREGGEEQERELSEGTAVVPTKSPCTITGK